MSGVQDVYMMCLCACVCAYAWGLVNGVLKGCGRGGERRRAECEDGLKDAPHI